MEYGFASDMPATPPNQSSGTAQCIRQQSQYGRSKGDVRPASLPEEATKREHHARDGCCDQQEHAELNQAAAVKGSRVSKNAGQRAQITWFAVKYVVLGRRAAVSKQKYDPTAQHDGRSDKHSGSKHRAENNLESLVGPERRCTRAHSIPFRPSYSISSASTTMTHVKRLRRSGVRTSFNMRAPIMAPASTPSATGITSPGST